MDAFWRSESRNPSFSVRVPYGANDLGCQRGVLKHGVELGRPAAAPALAYVAAARRLQTHPDRTPETRRERPQTAKRRRPVWSSDREGAKGMKGAIQKPKRNCRQRSQNISCSSSATCQRKSVRKSTGGNLGRHRWSGGCVYLWRRYWR